MVVMSNYLNQAGKETLNKTTVFISEAVPKSFYGPPKEVTPIDKLQSTPPQVGAAQLASGMPEPYISTPGYYANNTAFPMSYANFSQPAPWSTGTNNPQPAPQNFEHTAMQYSTLNPPAPNPANADGPQNHQFVAADHLFNQSNSAYQNAFSAAPYMNGSWSYFNNPSSFFFPTGNGDLNLSWGTAATENPQNNALFHDLYKPPPPPVDQEKGKAESVVSNELTSAFENSEVKTVEAVEQSFGSLNMNTTTDKEKEKVSESSNGQNVSVVSTAPAPAVTPPVKVSPVTTNSGQSNAPAKPVSWAAVASQPAKNKAPPKKPPPKTSTATQNGKPSHNAQNGNTGSTNANKNKQQQSNTGGRYRQNQGGNNNSNMNDVEPKINDSHLDINRLKDGSPLLKKLMAKYNFNPREFSMDLKNCRFFIIKSYSEDDIFRSIKYSSWTSTEHGNRRLNEAYKDQKKTGIKTPLYLLFSVNSSGHFCGVAEMTSEVDLNVETGIWVQDKWKGRFSVRWIYVKDVPNNTLRHIRLENNENKPVTNSRDTQEVHPDKGKQVLTIIHNFKAQTSIFDDFSHYEKRQEEDAKMRSKKMPEADL